MAGLVGDWHQLSGVVADRIAVPPEMAGAFPDALWLLPFRPRTFLPGHCLPSGTQPQLARTEDRARNDPALLVHLATRNGVVWPADLKLWVKLMGKLPSSSVIALACLPGTRALIPPFDAALSQTCSDPLTSRVGGSGERGGFKAAVGKARRATGCTALRQPHLRCARQRDPLSRHHGCILCFRDGHLSMLGGPNGAFNSQPRRPG
jgi:hypothetical protein